MAQDHSLTWGDLTLEVPSPSPDADDGWIIEAMAQGSHFGNPEALVEIVKSLLVDGSLAKVQGWDNRTVPIRLRLSAPATAAGPALAAAEAALMAEVMADDPSPLVWTPPATGAQPTVFDVVVATLDRDTDDGWDFNEVQREERHYLLTLTCHPFARAEDTTVAEALAIEPVSPTVTSIDAGTSTSGWSSDPSATITVDTGRLKFVYASAQVQVDVTRSGSVSVASDEYLSVEMESLSGWDELSFLPALRLYDTSQSAYVDPVFVVADGDLRTVYFPPPSSGGSYSSLTFRVTGPVSTLWVDNVETTDTLPITSTRQRARTVGVTGSARTQAALRVYDSDTPDELGDSILIYTSRSVQTVSLRADYLAASETATSDSTTMSGAYHVIGDGGATWAETVYRIPVTNLPAGLYSFMGRVRNTNAGGRVVTWEAKMTDSSGTDVIGSDQTVTGSFELASGTTAWQMLRFGAMQLPVVASEGDQYVQITLTGSTAALDHIEIDEAWLFNLTDGVLTWIEDTTSSLRWVEIRSPDITRPYPAVYGSDDETGANPVSISHMCESFGIHEFKPGLMRIWIGVTNSEAAQSEIELYPRYHSHVS